MGNRELGGLGFDVDRVLAFSNGEQERSVTGDVSVMIATHHDGQARPLTLLTLDDCASVGTALGAIHRLRPDFLQEAGYPVFSTGADSRAADRMDQAFASGWPCAAGNHDELVRRS